MTRRYPLVGMRQLCSLFGLSRQAWYAATKLQEKQCLQADIILDEVRRLRKEIPGLGTAKLHGMMGPFFTKHQIKMGRDKLHKLLKDSMLMASRKARGTTTTNSAHSLTRYPNLVKDLKPVQAGELWVSDMTYIPVGSYFGYLSVIMDGYSRKIVGWHFCKTLEAKGSLKALEMALITPNNKRKNLIHHSDRGVQYCSWLYVNRLRKEGVKISMTCSDDPNENALAERVFRTLKEDFKLTAFPTFSAAELAVERAINNYNALRPHASLGNKTPNEAHSCQGHHKLNWYPYKKVRYGNVQYDTDNEETTESVNTFQ